MRPSQYLYCSLEWDEVFQMQRFQILFALVSATSGFFKQRLYSQRMVIRIEQATSRVSIAVRGEGLEPRLEFEPNLVEFGPVLPHSTGDEVEVIVKNPTLAPIEFYSLNFDKQYLVEEKASVL